MLEPFHYVMMVMAVLFSAGLVFLWKRRKARIIGNIPS